jgi:hypothetical protein
MPAVNLYLTQAQYVALAVKAEKEEKTLVGEIQEAVDAWVKKA